ncbi:MAG: hypothetical protein L6W00_15215 [Lentisphaeria bacterium]|nr:MAG: hypothetical protein L6W00_15215 [Lentisphaeria bacterium]
MPPHAGAGETDRSGRFLALGRQQHEPPLRPPGGAGADPAQRPPRRRRPPKTRDGPGALELLRRGRRRRIAPS